MNFRKFTTKKGTLVLAGRNAKNNEELVKQAEASEIVLHTSAAGSGFVNIKGKPRFGDVKQAAVFCARYSQDWRNNKSDVKVHKFRGRDIYKEKGMKTGTFGVRKFKVIKVRKKDVEKWQ